MLFLLAHELHSAADIIFEAFGYYVLDLLGPIRFSKNTNLKKEAIKAYEEWKSLEELSRSKSIDRGEFKFADLE